MSDKKGLPNWKPADVLFCSGCEIIVKREKCKQDGGLFKEAGYFCPVCDGKLADAEEPTK